MKYSVQGAAGGAGLKQGIFALKEFPPPAPAGWGVQEKGCHWGSFFPQAQGVPTTPSPPLLLFSPFP